MNELTLKQAYEGLKEKKFSSVELTQACLKRIEERNKDINAFITVASEVALEQAKRADEMIASGQQKMLTGIPYSVKDAICVEDMRSTGSAKILDNYIAPYPATVIKKIQEQGGVILGKVNCDAFGHGASNENSMYGPVKNPHDLSKVAGGSSGGSAASVADHMCIYGIAEDTGGSIRFPASLCGVVGLRPSYGRNSRYGIMPMASSLDTVGPIAKTSEDIAIILEAMAGKDEKDGTTVDVPVPHYGEHLEEDISGLRVGVPKEYFEMAGMDEETRVLVEKKIQQFKELGCELVEVSLPYTKYAVPVYYILVPSEDSSNLGRLDGIRYGVREEADTLLGIYAQSRAKGFPEEVKRRIMIGTYALSAGYYDAYYRKAQKVRTLISQDFERVFREVDVLVTPTSPFPAFDLGEKSSDPLAMYLADIFVGPAAVAGIPGISLPAGNTTAGLPVGLQIMGKRMSEELLLRVGHQIQ
ncbi:MAG: Asp-tRNA(Asn)/Glu-tRNA(Gln) amidotransferase GatCAB subunit A [Candidatus Magasanikbacteria bacterium CG11_big_fil_rev_8_21_14_0_20_39_34]|uniref:Glutamyl-tRNA(Gln) amidotransferase subunit A n=1 Tax=Candidatus Magasanikbacteria bacterium CG11_big_fil_rev_8_21_14_0_20_39_34 TaxID=1974653 RepID=A0A2H0N5V3_9BACT|nr:MAG: Asp-tRNA(Asn)/Glu-tRNA(Gln) amidotransferase GatCAB subunit A [Candidatus Magasanikbacteria bacterium CG11_big_fil_rev_8_21_14_0_20_39_34]